MGRHLLPRAVAPNSSTTGHGCALAAKAPLGPSAASGHPGTCQGLLRSTLLMLPAVRAPLPAHQAARAHVLTLEGFRGIHPPVIRVVARPCAVAGAGAGGAGRGTGAQAQAGLAAGRRVGARRRRQRVARRPRRPGAAGREHRGHAAARGGQRWRVNCRGLVAASGRCQVVGRCSGGAGRCVCRRRTRQPRAPEALDAAPYCWSNDHSALLTHVSLPQQQDGFRIEDGNPSSQLGEYTTLCDMHKQQAQISSHTYMQLFVLQHLQTMCEKPCVCVLDSAYAGASGTCRMTCGVRTGRGRERAVGKCSPRQLLCMEQAALLC